MNKTIFIFKKLLKNYTNNIENTNKIIHDVFMLTYAHIRKVHSIFCYDTKNAPLKVTVDLNNCWYVN